MEITKDLKMALCVESKGERRGREISLCVDTRDSDRVVRWYYVWTLETATGS